jgi:hypothetical protein
VVVAPPTDAPIEEPTIVVTEPPIEESTRVVTEEATEESTRVVTEPVIEEPTKVSSADPATSSAVSVIRVWTADGNWGPKTIFQPGDAIQWIITVENTGDQQARIDLIFEAFGPNRQRTAYWTGSVSTEPGVKSWDYKGMVTDEMLGFNNFIGHGTDQNSASQATMTYQVTLSPAVTPALDIQLDG